MYRLPLHTLTLTLVACFLSANTLYASAQDRPNIVFVFTDDHAPQSISAYGSIINKTPHIDRLADEGAIFLRNVCANSICGPSRATVLTGKHSHSNGFISNHSTFDSTQKTFPLLLQQAGYDTAMLGKWHLKSDPVGFNRWEILPGQGKYYNPDLYTAEGTKRYEGYVTDIITDLSLDWLDKGRDKDKPFLLMCQQKAPHRTWAPGPDHLTLFDDIDITEPPTLFDDFKNRAPALTENKMMIGKHMMYDWDLKVPGLGIPNVDGQDRVSMEYARMTLAQKTKWKAAYGPKNEAFKKFLATSPSYEELTRWKYQRYIKDYLRCIQSVDDNVGRLLNYLDKSGLAENTIVIYSSDQGFYLGEHGLFDKRWMYEESFSMPLLVRWPGQITPGTKISQLTQNIDFAPTLLELAGVEAPTDMHGISLTPLFKDSPPENWRSSVYYHYYDEGGHNVDRHEGVATDRFKLVHYYRTMDWELLDRVRDPLELHSFYDDPAYAEVRTLMEEHLALRRTQYDAPPLEQVLREFQERRKKK
jgi:arylsulfatase A-like enzyme